MEEIFVGCPHRLTYHNARANVSFINDGTCAFTLELAGGAQVTSGSMPKVVGDTRGTYSAVIPGSALADLVVGSEYLATITFTGPDGKNDKRFLTYKAARPGSR